MSCTSDLLELAAYNKIVGAIHQHSYAGSVRVLVSWVGKKDLQAVREAEVGPQNRGPNAAALEDGDFDLAVLLSDWDAEQTRGYEAWLAGRTNAQVRVEPCSLRSPIAMDAIYREASRVVTALLGELGSEAELTFHLSAGTPAMASVWILLAKCEHPARLIQSSWESGVEEADVPFDFDAVYVGSRHSDDDLLRLASGLPRRHPAFDELIHECAAMKEIVARATILASSSVPVLIEGESGTGKEVLARCIHRASKRAERPFIAVNCGALPKSVVESELFGHKKGAFSGAIADHPGLFRKAHGGTLFLDELGELEPDVQVRLLRVLQERKVRGVGETVEVPIDVRVVAATNRHLAEEVRAGRFREDLFFRLAVGVLPTIPPLRERGPDVKLLIESILAGVNEKLGEESEDFTPKSLRVGARRVFERYEWPGNVRELQNTLTRAVLWSHGDAITQAEAEAALLTLPKRSGDDILSRPLGEGFDIAELIEEVRDHYVARAWDEGREIQAEAARLLGLDHYQTYSNWLRRARERGRLPKRR